MIFMAIFPMTGPMSGHFHGYNCNPKFAINGWSNYQLLSSSGSHPDSHYSDIAVAIRGCQSTPRDPDLAGGQHWGVFFVQSTSGWWFRSFSIPPEKYESQLGFSLIC